MDFTFSDEQLAMAELASQILTDGATPERMRPLERDPSATRFDPELWSDLAEAGLLGLTVPEAHGGAGLGFLELALVIEQVGRTTAPVPYLETMVYGALPLAQFGSDAQQAEFLPKLVTGEAIFTGAMNDGEGEIDELETTASADGEGWKLSGVKYCVPAGQLACRILVPAKTASGEIGIFLVNPEAKGVGREALTTTSRQPEVTLTLRDVAVGRQDLLGELSQGAQILEWIDQRGTAAQCALALGVCEVALELTAQYTKERKQFDQPIATFQAVGQRAADAFIDTEGIRLTSWQASWRLAEGLDASREIACAKIWAAEAGQRIVHAATHLHGGMGVDRDYPLHRHFLYAKVLELTHGSATRHLRRLGKSMADGIPV